MYLQLQVKLPDLNPVMTLVSSQILEGAEHHDQQTCSKRFLNISDQTLLLAKGIKIEN